MVVTERITGGDERDSKGAAGSGDPVPGPGFNGEKIEILTASHIIIATGGRPRMLPGVETDGKRVESTTVSDPLAFIEAYQARFKVPEFVDFSEAPLPRNPAGKILKDSLRGRGSGAFDPDLLG